MDKTAKFLVFYHEYSDKQKIADEKNLVRMSKELERTKESMKLTEEDLFKVRTINRAIKDKLHAVEDKALMEEEGLKVCVCKNFATICHNLRCEICCAEYHVK